jgi:hypothetical protein
MIDRPIPAASAMRLVLGRLALGIAQKGEEASDKTGGEERTAATEHEGLGVGHEVRST